VFNTVVKGGKYNVFELGKALGAMRVTPKEVWAKLEQVRARNEPGRAGGWWALGWFACGAGSRHWIPAGYGLNSGV